MVCRAQVRQFRGEQGDPADVGRIAHWYLKDLLYSTSGRRLSRVRISERE